VAGAFFYCSKAGLQRRVVRVEGILNGSMYVGKPNHLYIQRNLNIKLFTALWFVRTVRSFLSKRSTTIVVDGVETAPQLLAAGVPQGSPLSPMLFLCYNAPLLEALNLLELRLSTLGFADDINLLTYSESTVVNCITLESAHDRCLAWASTHGMKFALRKYTLTHFTQRSNFDLEAPIQINGREIAPKPVVRILGVQLDTKLSWNAHTEAINQKMKT
jgi:hypothetical protein